MPTRVFSNNFPPIFKYLPSFSVPSSVPQRQISQEEKYEVLINKNREALEQQMKMLENYAVDITEDSMSSDMLPHANPPLSLSFVVEREQHNLFTQENNRNHDIRNSYNFNMRTQPKPNAIEVQDYYVHCPKLFKSAQTKNHTQNNQHTVSSQLTR